MVQILAITGFVHIMHVWLLCSELVKTIPNSCGGNTKKIFLTIQYLLRKQKCNLKGWLIRSKIVVSKFGQTWFQTTSHPSPHPLFFVVYNRLDFFFSRMGKSVMTNLLQWWKLERIGERRLGSIQGRDSRAWALIWWKMVHCSSRMG